MLLAIVAGCASKSALPPLALDGGADGAQPRPLPRLGASDELCKLLSNKNTSDPSANDVQFRANVLGADLGIPVEDNDRLYIFFGDTIGFAGIWGNESHPDSVGYAADPASVVEANPSLLCSDLGIITLPPDQSRGPQVDARVQADFAGAAMAAPAGHTLGEYIHNPAGTGAGFPYLPGDFEVPSGAFSYLGAIYIFYTTVVSPTDITMIGSYLARWAAPSPTTLPGYAIQYAVDERSDAGGALGGNFINIAAEVQGDYVYLFGTGTYRASPVHVARAPLDSLGIAQAIEVLPGTIDTPGYGETSVRYFPEIDRWMFLAEESGADYNHIVARFADHPDGPWSDSIVVHDMADAGFRGQYCCTVDNTCDGKQMFNCDRTGFYGTYLFPELRAHPDGSFTVTYTMSSFDPYDVAVFETTFLP